MQYTHTHTHIHTQKGMKWNDPEDGKARGLKATYARKKNVIRYGIRIGSPWGNRNRNISLFTLHKDSQLLRAAPYLELQADIL